MAGGWFDVPSLRGRWQAWGESLPRLKTKASLRVGRVGLDLDLRLG